MAARSQILKKEQEISDLLEARQNILSEVSTLSEAQQVQVFLGAWSVRDLLAHLIGWDRANLQAARSVLKGEQPSFYEYHDRDWRTYNALLVKKHKKGSGKELLAGAKVSQEKLIAFVQAIPPENFGKDFGVRFRGYKVTVQRLLEAEAGDERTHYQQIVDFFKAAK